MKYIKSSYAKVSIIIIISLIFSGITGYQYAKATIASNNSAVNSQYSCEKGAAFIIAVDNSGTPNYYAIEASSTATVPCGTLVYGGTINAGGITGTSAGLLINKVILSLGVTGGQILFECGTYSITIPITDNGASNVRISGIDWKCVDLQFTNAVSTTAVSITTNYWTFDNIYFDCSATWTVENNSVNCIADTGSHLTVNSIYAYKGSHAGLFITGADNMITNSFFVQNGLEGIGAVGTPSNVTISNNHIIDANAAPALGGIGMAGCNDITIIGNVISGTGSTLTSPSVGVAIEVGTTSNKDVTITGNIFYRLGTYGIITETGSPIAVDGLSITGNTFFEIGYRFTTTSSQDAILIATGDDVSITGNTITSTEGVGIQTRTATNGITITSNVIYNASSDGLTFPITINSPDTLVQGNVINATTVTNGRGIFLSNTATNFVVSSNSIIGLKGSLVGIEPSGTTAGAIEDNTIDKSSKGGAGDAIKIGSPASHILVEGNTILAGAISIQISAGTDFVTVLGNYMNGTVTNQGGADSIISINIGVNPFAITTFTAGTSVYTYTNTNGYDIQWQLFTANGISAWTCDGITGISTVAGSGSCVTPPGGTMAITWTVTAPVFKGIPLEA